MSWPSVDAVEFIVCRSSDFVTTFCRDTSITLPPNVELNYLSFADGIKLIVSDTLVWIDVGLTKITDGVVANRIKWVEVTRTWCNCKRTRPEVVALAITQGSQLELTIDVSTTHPECPGKNSEAVTSFRYFVGSDTSSAVLEHTSTLLDERSYIVELHGQLCSCWATVSLRLSSRLVVFVIWA